MSWARYAFAARPYAGIDVSDSTPPNQVLPPPIPGGTTAYYWSAENGRYPYAYGGWAGARPQIVFFPGGVIAVPDRERGVITLFAWWPYATTMHIIRIHPDGTRHPVRGGYGIPIMASTRGNWATNPSFEVGLNGVTPDAGSPTVTRITDTAAPSGSYIMRATIAGTGSNGVTIPTSLRGASPATIGFAARYSERPTGVRVTVTWTDVGGGSLGTTTLNLTADQINMSVGQFARQVVTTTPPTMAYTPTIKIIADGMSAGSTVDLDAITIEQGTTDGSFFDGSSLGGTWSGTVGLSTSALAPMQIVEDAEAPLDISLTYIVADPSLTGGQVVSDPTALSSYGRWCWLTHPTNGQDPLRVDLRSVPVLEREIDQGVFWPIGARTAVVVSAAQRRGVTAELGFNVTSFADRDALIDVMSDGLPLLLRAPAHYGYGEGTWFSFGRVTEDREDRRAYQDVMLVTAAATEVSPPAPETVFA